MIILAPVFMDNKVTLGGSGRVGLPSVGSLAPESSGNIKDHVCLLR